MQCVQPLASPTSTGIHQVCLKEGIPTHTQVEGKVLFPPACGANQQPGHGSSAFRAHYPAMPSILQNRTKSMSCFNHIKDKKSHYE